MSALPASLDELLEDTRSAFSLIPADSAGVVLTGIAWSHSASESFPMCSEDGKESKRGGSGASTPPPPAPARLVDFSLFLRQFWPKVIPVFELNT